VIQDVATYPNPFFESTSVEYTVSHRGHVSVKIRNLLGNDVATLFDGDQDAGIYSLTFRGDGLPSGCYFCAINDGTSIHLTPIILARDGH
jgi:hypothetical protein